MAEGSPEKDGPSLGGCLFALLVGPAVVGGVALAFSRLTGRPLSDEGGVLLFQAAVVAAPFALISLAGTRDKLPWAVALGLTLALWGYYLFDGVRYHWSGDTSGANIGLGLIMLVSPVAIAGAAVGVHAWRRRRR